MADHKLSDDQAHQLLIEAEQRLRSTQPRNQAIQTRPTSLAALQKSSFKGQSEKPIFSYITTTENGAQVDSSHLVSERERNLSNRIRIVEDPVATRRKAALDKKATAGSSWYNLPRTIITPELKRDLQLLRMRGVLDPKRHYKKEGSKPLVAEFSQVGTIIEGPTEYFSARLTNKERKRTFTEEILSAESASGRFRNKYGEIQASKTSGRKEYYKNLKAKRRDGRVSKT